MQVRMKHPALMLPAALEALQALNKAAVPEGLPDVTRKLVHLRASQINGCSHCVDMHARELKQAKQSDERIFALSAWRETPYYSEPERAALALTEAVTRLADRTDPVSDEVWNEARRHYDEPTLAALIIQISLINTWNRLGVTVRHFGGARS